MALATDDPMKTMLGANDMARISASMNVLSANSDAAITANAWTRPCQGRVASAGPPHIPMRSA